MCRSPPTLGVRLRAQEHGRPERASAFGILALSGQADDTAGRSPHLYGRLR